PRAAQCAPARGHHPRRADGHGAGRQRGDRKRVQLARHRLAPVRQRELAQLPRGAGHPGAGLAGGDRRQHRGRPRLYVARPPHRDPLMDRFDFISRFARNRGALLGAGLILLVALMAVLAPLLYPTDPLRIVGAPELWPGEDPDFPLGTASLGRPLLAPTLPLPPPPLPT